GTRVRVTNLANLKSVVVRITDRGPYFGGRILDLSYAAGRKLGLARPGVAKVQIHILSRGRGRAEVASRAATAPAPKNARAAATDRRPPIAHGTRRQATVVHHTGRARHVRVAPAASQPARSVVPDSSAVDSSAS